MGVLRTRYRGMDRRAVNSSSTSRVFLNSVKPLRDDHVAMLLLQ